jgi:1,4-alpha-glucan branching enzyme
MSIYEMHLASWRRHEDGTSLSYRELAELLPAYLQEAGFTHVEFMPVMEHPYDPSWGYQVTGYFAPTSRFGNPDDLKFLIDKLHQAAIGVILDWVPSHFPSDAHGLGYFDGSHLYEHPDTRKGYHPDWQSLIFNYGRNEIKSFLISNALYWLDEFHADGLRVDAVASMIYLDYSRKEGEWEPNRFGGREYIEAIDLLKLMNETVYRYHPDIITIAEESTAFPGVSHPTYDGGLGFGMKWMMGWMHDTLNYFKLDPLFRKHSHNQITFSMIYNYSENYVLPFSHDEVVHGKGSLLSRMPGEGQDQFAQLRLMLGYMFTHPGAKLLFMGCEFGQRSEWNFAAQLEWSVMGYESHRGIFAWVKTLNGLYKTEKSLHEQCTKPEGFRWIRVDDWQQSVLAYERIAVDANDRVLVLLNLTPVDRTEYRIGTEATGSWDLIDHSDKPAYWGRNRDVHGNVNIEAQEWEEKKYSMAFALPGLTALIYKYRPGITNKPAKKPAKKPAGSGKKTADRKK